MPLEPAAEQSIKGYRHRARVARCAEALMTLLFAVIAGGLFLALIYAMIQLRNPNAAQQLSNRRLVPGILLMILMMAAITVRVVMVSSRYRFRMRRLIATPPAVDEAALSRYQSALESISLRIGRPAPPVVAATFPTANSFTYKKGNGYLIAVSPELLDADIGIEQAESIMAHELAHVEAGSAARLSMGLAPALCFVSIAVFLALAVFSILTKHALYVWLLAAPAGLCFSMMMFERAHMPLLAGRMPSEKGSRSTFLDAVAGRSDSRTLSDTVADSIAASMISAPSMLASTIKKLAGAMSKSETMPDELIADYLFIAPTKPWVPKPLGPNRDYNPAVYGQISREGQSPSASDRYLPKFTRRGKQREVAFVLEQNMVLYLASNKQAVAKRLANLQEIERGNWHEFTEVTKGRVRLQPKAWE